VLRLTAGFFIVTNIADDWIYPMTAWTSWLIPPAVFKLFAVKRPADNGPLH